MKSLRCYHLFGKSLAFVASLLALFPASAATLIQGDPEEGGIAYSWQMFLTGSDSGTISGTVSAWSWQDEGFAGEPGFGWAHTSSWIALSLGASSQVTITIQRDPNVPFAGSGNINGFAPTEDLYPAFTLWAGWDNDPAPAEVALALGYPEGEVLNHHHTFNNHGDVIWAEKLSYVGHVFNDSEESVSATWVLPAGLYTLAIGGNAPSDNTPPRQGFALTVTVVPVPEPSAVLLLGMAAGFMRRCR